MVSMGHTTRVVSERELPNGPCAVSVEFRPGGASHDGQNLRLLIDGEVVAGGNHAGAALFAALSTAGGGLLVGRDRGLPVCDDYEPPFTLDATLKRLVVRSAAARARRDTAEVIRTATASD